MTKDEKRLRRRVDDANGYDVRLGERGGPQLRMLMFSWLEHRWIFSYTLRDPPEGPTLGEGPDLINETRCVADYTAGELQPVITVSQHIIIPRRLGQRHFLGVDVSPGAKTYVEQTYRRPSPDADHFNLTLVTCGATRRVEFNAPSDTEAAAHALVPALPDLPWFLPIPRAISRVVGDGSFLAVGPFRIPFPTGPDSAGEFKLPATYVRRSPVMSF